VRDVADALAVAHDKGVLHRDIKPSNILMDPEGKPRLTDFGLAKDTRTESKYTRTGQTLGTPAYMSPEQARGDLAQLTPASDVWALGCVLYELLANRPAFEGDSPAAVIGNVVLGRPMPLEAVPPRVKALLEACLSKPAAGRPADATALQRDLDRLLRGQRPLHGPPRARRRWVGVAVGGVAIAGAAAWGLSLSGTSPPPPLDPVAQSASDAWASRRTDLESATARLAHACAQRPAQAQWHVRLGILRWAGGDTEGALAAWAAVRSDAAHATRAAWLRGLVRFSLALERVWERNRFDLARAEWDVAAAGTGRERAWAEAGIAMLDLDFARTESLLEHETHWEAVALRAMNARVSMNPDRDSALALRLYESVLATGLPHTWCRLNRAALLIEAGAADDAEQELALVLNRRPDHFFALQLQAKLLIGRRAFGEAIDRLQRVIELHPGYIPAHIDLATTLRLLGRPREALEVLESFGEFGGQEAAARNVLGGCLRDLGRPHDALQQLRKAEAADSGSAKVAANLALVESDLGQAEAADSRLSKALDRHPDSVDLLHARAIVRQRAGRLEQARADYDRILQQEDAFPTVWAGRALVRELAGDVAGALEDYEQALRRNSTERTSLNNQALLLHHAGRSRDALALLDRAVNAHPDDAASVANRAMVRSGLGDGAGALADYRRAVELDERLALAWFGIGLSHHLAGQAAEARAAYDRALAIDSDHVNARRNRALLSADAGDYVAAEADLHAALRSDPRHLESALTLTEIYEALGKASEAKMLATRLLAAGVSEPQAGDLRRLIQRADAALAGKRR
jgi:tetratricopeptide (TPR) repeat protein